MDPNPVNPDPAATVIVLRPSAEPFEVLMVIRHARGFFGSLVVFPGGGVDEADRSEAAQEAVAGDGLDHDHRSAALRELAEETGLLAAPEGIVSASGSRGRDLYDELKRRRMSLPGNDLVLVSRWVTPEMAPRRFDTRFYLLGVDETPPVTIDEDELVGYSWVTPHEALSRYEEGEWPMVLPTLAHLRWLSHRHSVSDALASARGADGRSVIEPQRAADGSLVPTLMPGEM